MARPVRKAVLPVAGMGTRFLPATRAVPKELLPVVDKPLIQYAVEEARAAGIEQFIFVTGRGKTAIRKHFEPDEYLGVYLSAREDHEGLALAANAVLPPGAASFTRQRKPLGLGHAVLCARDLVGDEPFAVLLPDELLLGDPPCLAALVELHGRTGGSVVALAEVPAHETGRYGIVEVAAEDGQALTLSGMVEKPRRARHRRDLRSSAVTCCNPRSSRGLRRRRRARAARSSSPTPWPRWPGRRRFTVCATGAGASIAGARPATFRRRSPAPWKGRT